MQSHSIYDELEMQRRALVGLKTQRGIDRSRRLMLLKRIKKEKAEHERKLRQIRIEMFLGFALITVLTFFALLR